MSVDMKRFLLMECGLGLLKKQKWQRAGFSIYPFVVEDVLDFSVPDIIWLGTAKRKSIDTNFLAKLYPKLFFLHSSAAGCMPTHWRAYAQQTVRVAGSDWIVGSKLEEPLPPAMAEYLAQQKTADLAAVLYIVILESVFRETAEWCGHMSSVVGRM